ncbi:MAG: endonuclease/exonuclease/phosphatase family protein [Planctomycetaceae bacterium]|jgi:endonuclease/exonuclease/phosphatase family metal-dependent hydrolase|nr:endonuclease/exonuclease/phosphatase family protein [Planctomycetaceae bacterium]
MMKYCAAVFIFALCTACAFTAETELKVMSFNIWVGGGDSVQKTFDVIKQTGADIVGIQEPSKANVNNAEKFAEDLGWFSHTHIDLRERNNTIISRYPIVGTSPEKIGVKIQISGKQFVWMFNVHLHHSPYEPYSLNGIQYGGAPLLNTAEQALESAWKTRGKEVERTLADIIAVQKDGYPVFLTGDFNEPSCLDWTEKAAKAGQCRIPVRWTATAAFIDKAGMIDSYRKIYSDEAAKPGHTWTPRPGKKEVHDRIDFLFYSGGKVRLDKVQIIGEPGGKSDVGIEGYPSDHRAVLGTFTVL